MKINSFAIFPWWIGLVLFVISCSSPDQNLCLADIKVGNGLAIHPTSQHIVISKPTGEIDANGKPKYSLYNVHWEDNDVLTSEIASLRSEYSDYHPVFSTSGDFVLFNSTRPAPNDSIANGKVEIYMSKCVNNVFMPPEYIKQVNTAYHDSYPSLTKTNKLYFNSDRPGGKGMMDIYVSEFRQGSWTVPLIVDELNSEHSENDLVVDPDERFIIFNRYEKSKNEIDLFISFLNNGVWSRPTPLHAINQDGIWELTPTLSIDGGLLYCEVENRIQCFRLDTILPD